VVVGDLPQDALQTSVGLSNPGPLEVDGHAGSGRDRAYARTTSASDEQRQQLIAITQGGAGLGRVRDMATGLPDRHFAGDVVFPLGLWKQGEIRQFEATEFTVAGPARRLVTLEIMDLDHPRRRQPGDRLRDLGLFAGRRAGPVRCKQRLVGFLGMHRLPLPGVTPCAEGP